MSCRCRICLFLTVLVALCSLTILGSARGGETSSCPLSQLQADSKTKPLELIAVPEDEEWLALVAAPIAAQMKSQKKIPVIIILSPEHAEEQRRLVNQLKPLSNSSSMLSLDPDRNMFEARKEPLVRLQVVRPNLTQASILLTKSFWKDVNRAVVASTHEPEAAILASTLAAHLRVPFIPYESIRNLEELSRALNTLEATTVYFCTNNKDENQTVSSFFRQKVEFLDVSSINKRIIDLLGTNKIRNLILARVPEKETDVGTQSWIAPYLSTMHGAPIVLCSSPDGVSAEQKVKDLIMRYSLRPQTVTILADYDSIMTITIKDSKNLGDYEVNVEPCSLPFSGTAAAVGIGRIPFAQLWACSNMIARGFVREFILGRNEPRLLMIANPNSESGSLPLAEVVSRITAEEYKNLKLPVTEFYRVPASDKRIVDAAGKVNLIIYEGHLGDQSIFNAPYDVYDYAEQPIEYKEYLPNDQSDLTVPSEHNSDFSVHNSIEVSTEDESAVYNDYRYVEDLESHHTGTTTQEYFPNVEIEQLEGLPFVILQSCHSLEEGVAKQVFSIGGVAVMGSVTNIHSASGSAFIKAFCDGLIYRGDTPGEALRDARNYFLCLSSLKEQRGHQEMAKVYRVAMSFCLWGDPELRIINGPYKPSRKPVSAAFIGSDTIRISTPRRRLPESRNEKYFTRMFPGSQVAGIVKRLKDKEARRLMPIYFFRLPLPNQFDISAHTKLQRDGETDCRAVFLTDPLGRHMYVLYFPEKETKGEVFDLRFTFK